LTKWWKVRKLRGVARLPFLWVVKAISGREPLTKVHAIFLPIKPSWSWCFCFRFALHGNFSDVINVPGNNAAGQPDRRRELPIVYTSAPS